VIILPAKKGDGGVSIEYRCACFDKFQKGAIKFYEAGLLV
jgi:hypothetical protein